jgi:hypothetical protein
MLTERAGAPVTAIAATPAAQAPSEANSRMVSSRPDGATFNVIQPS